VEGIARVSEWIDRRTASKLIGITVHGFSTEWYRGALQPVIEHKPAEFAGIPHASGPNRLGYWRADCERLGRVVKRCGISIADACKVLAALEKDGPL
jgi:hypothetical protein